VTRPDGAHPRVVVEPDDDALGPIRNALRAHNQAAVGAYGAKRYAVIDDHGGAFGGGLYGWLAWGWLVIDLAFVPPELRRRGVGARLLARFEALARAEGVRRARLNTASFQGALPFYLRQGFEVFAELPVTAPGGVEYVDYYLRKAL
jgi:GNAT superfamily N-acetyltransferase